MVQIFYRHIRSEKLKTLDAAKVGSWVNAVAPSDRELLELAETYGLDHCLLLDGVDLHESPRIEDEDGATYIYTRFCYSEGGRIHTAPILIVYAKQHLITVLPKPFTGFDKLTRRPRAARDHPEDQAAAANPGRGAELVHQQPQFGQPHDLPDPGRSAPGRDLQQGFH